MGYQRGPFGVEYDNNRPEDEESSLARRLLIAVGIVATISLSYTIYSRIRNAAEKETPPTETPTVVVESQPQPIATTAEKNAPSPGGGSAADFANRPREVRNLLMRLQVAEASKDVEMAIQTIERLRQLPGCPAADIDNHLAKRLGTLNVKRLFTLRTGEWVKKVQLRSGEDLARLSTEYGTTLAATQRLNPELRQTKSPSYVYVINHPKFQLNIYKLTKTADLSLGGKFFKRYYLTDNVEAPVGFYQLPVRASDFFSAKGIHWASGDVAEIEMLLIRGTPIVISDFR